MIPGFREAQARYDAQESPEFYAQLEPCYGDCGLSLDDCRAGRAGACVRCSECGERKAYQDDVCCDSAEAAHFTDCPFPSEDCRCSALAAAIRQRMIDYASQRAIDEARRSE